MQVKKQQLESDMEQQSGSKWEKEYIKAVYCHPAYLTYMPEYIMRNAWLDEAQAGIKIVRRNINNVRHTDDEFKRLIILNDDLKLNTQKAKIWSRKWQPSPVFLPGKFHGQRSLAGYGRWGCKSWTRL